MAVPLFREMFPGVTVIASATAAKTLQAEKAVAFFCKMDDMLTGALIQSGVVGEQHRRPPLAANQIAVDRVVQEGDRIEVDEGVALEVLETPGHSDCSLSFYDRGAPSPDHLRRHGLLRPGVRHLVAELLHGLRRVRAFDRASGHAGCRRAVPEP